MTNLQPTQPRLVAQVYQMPDGRLNVQAAGLTAKQLAMLLTQLLGAVVPQIPEPAIVAPDIVRVG